MDRLSDFWFGAVVGAVVTLVTALGTLDVLGVF
jgi:hypothetical protein